MFEIGAKTEFLDHKVRLNLAGYVGTYKNIQLDFSGQYEDFINGVRVVTTRTTMVLETHWEKAGPSPFPVDREGKKVKK